MHLKITFSTLPQLLHHHGLLLGAENCSKNSMGQAGQFSMEHGHATSHLYVLASSWLSDKAAMHSCGRDTACRLLTAQSGARLCQVSMLRMLHQRKHSEGSSLYRLACQRLS